MSRDALPLTPFTPISRPVRGLTPPAPSFIPTSTHGADLTPPPTRSF
jgi:hypothetical protein